MCFFSSILEDYSVFRPAFPFLFSRLALLSAPWVAIVSPFSFWSMSQFCSSALHPLSRAWAPHQLPFRFPTAPLKLGTCRGPEAPLGSPHALLSGWRAYGPKGMSGEMWSGSKEKEYRRASHQNLLAGYFVIGSNYFTLYPLLITLS